MRERAKEEAMVGDRSRKKRGMRMKRESRGREESIDRIKKSKEEGDSKSKRAREREKRKKKEEERGKTRGDHSPRLCSK